MLGFHSQGDILIEVASLLWYVEEVLLTFWDCLWSRPCFARQ